MTEQIIMFHTVSDLISSLLLCCGPTEASFLTFPQTYKTHFCPRAFEFDVPSAWSSLPTNSSMAQSHFLQTLFSSHPALTHHFAWELFPNTSLQKNSCPSYSLSISLTLLHFPSEVSSLSDILES